MDKHLKAAVAGLVTALAITGAAAAPAQAAKPDPKESVVNSDTYSALGDSYAAGGGSGVPINTFGQTLEAHPVLLAGKVNKVNFLATSGATTTQVMAEQVGEIPATTRQVTLTVGGSDLNAFGSATSCLTNAATCQTALTQFYAGLGTLTMSLYATIGAIRAEAPDAQIYVTGYPLLFQAEQTEENNGFCVVGVSTATGSPTPVPVTEAQADALDDATLALNAAISGAVALADATYDDATYVDVTDDFDGNGLCGTLASGGPNPDSYIQPINITPSGVDMTLPPLHPTADGQDAYADAILTEGFENRALTEG